MLFKFKHLTPTNMYPVFSMPEQQEPFKPEVLINVRLV